MQSRLNFEDIDCRRSLWYRRLPTLWLHNSKLCVILVANCECTVIVSHGMHCASRRATIMLAFLYPNAEDACSQQFAHDGSIEIISAKNSTLSDAAMQGIAMVDLMEPDKREVCVPELVSCSCVRQHYHGYISSFKHA